MSLASEFKEFAVKGNAIDLAVGIVIGAAFGNIVNSLVNDIIMPPIGLLLGGVNFVDLFVPLKAGATAGMTLAAAKAAGIPVIAYGNFVQVIINFLIIAFSIFMVIKMINRMKRDKPAKQ